MIMESLNKYLETVDEYIFDNDKLVTYKWLSKELEVHVNIAKQILWEFWQQKKDEKTFDCTFLLMGTLKDGGIRIEVIKEKDLAPAKDKFTAIISEHIYSLQKALPDIQTLGLAEDGDVKYSGIKFLENNKRSAEEMHAIRWGAAAAEIPSVSHEQTSAPEVNKEKEGKSPEKKLDDVNKNDQKKGFNNLFGKAVNKQKSPPSALFSKSEKTNSSKQTKQSPKKDMSKSSKRNTQKGGLNSFLQQVKNEVKPEHSVSSEPEKITNSVVKESVREKITSEKQTNQKKSTRGKKRNRSKDINTNIKRRKRIAIQSDSSEESGSSDENEENIPSSPSPEKVLPVKKLSPSPPKVKHEDGKRRVLKMVDKTFEEDGFLVTKKVHVYESCSEEEPEVVPKKSVPPESHPEPKGKRSTKQTTLMNFFKKS
nr:DNA polymerase delta subunit 3-like [Megalopta genalis]